MAKKKKTFWRIWAKALGEKGSKNDKEADIIAGVRTFIFFTYLITNIAIVANAVRHWNDNDRNPLQISRDHTGYVAKPLQAR